MQAHPCCTEALHSTVGTPSLETSACNRKTLHLQGLYGLNHEIDYCRFTLTLEHISKACVILMRCVHEWQRRLLFIACDKHVAHTLFNSFTLRYCSNSCLYAALDIGMSESAIRH